MKTSPASDRPPHRTSRALAIKTGRSIVSGQQETTTVPRLGLWSGIGMVVASMIGSGVFLSAGYMAQDLSPGQILAAWIVGLVLALAGAWAYAAVAMLVPRSGGEYRYLHDLLHPSLGYLAGWVSLLVGFSAPIAINAVAAAAFAGALGLKINQTLLAALLVATLTTVHAWGWRSSVGSQNALVLLKSALVLAFVVIGLSLGTNRWPTWQPPHASAAFPLSPFVGSLFYVAFAFSGWNAAAYAASEFRDPRRDVPRAMLVGCCLVGVVYLVVNWVFVANLTPERAIAIAQESGRLTLGHLIMTQLVGVTGAKIMSAFMVVTFLSTMSAYTYAGPRVCSAMAKDGFLPLALAGGQDQVPRWSVVLQGGLATALVFAYQVQEVLQNIGAILTLFSALTVLALFKVRFQKTAQARPSTASLIAASVFVVLSAWMLYYGFKDSPSLALWVVAICAAALLAYTLTRTTARDLV